MAKYYEPMLFAGTSRHPNNMGMMAVLQEPVDGELLGEVAESLRERFPYFYVRAEISGNSMIAVPNPLPITVRNTWEKREAYRTAMLQAPDKNGLDAVLKIIVEETK